MYSGVPVTAPVLVSARRVDLAREAEVDDERVPAAVVPLDEDVGRLDVAVHEALAMRGVQRAATSRMTAMRSSRVISWPTADSVLPSMYCIAMNGSPGELADAVDLADVGVLDARLRARFAHQARRLLGAGRRA